MSWSSSTAPMSRQWRHQTRVRVHVIMTSRPDDRARPAATLQRHCVTSRDAVGAWSVSRRIANKHKRSHLLDDVIHVACEFSSRNKTSWKFRVRFVFLKDEVNNSGSVRSLKILSNDGKWPFLNNSRKLKTTILFPKNDVIFLPVRNFSSSCARSWPKIILKNPWAEHLHYFY